ncbi:MAG: hypothetical protein U0T79_06195 [Ferruginibacter sp.]
MIKSRQRKSKSFFARTETWFKKYQATFSILIPTIISLLALLLSLNANKLAKTQIQKDKIPNWDYKIINDSENDNQAIQITSLKAGFKVENLEILTPFTNLSTEIIHTENDT